MMQHAPAWARRRRRTLVPAFATFGIVAFIALLVLPPMQQASSAHVVALLFGAVSWPALMLLLNGDPVDPPRITQAAMDAGTTTEFTVRYREDEMAAAQRALWFRWVREQRLGTTFVGPFATLFLVAVCWKLSGLSGPTMAFLAFAGAMILMQATMPMLIARQGARQAQRHPEQRVRVSATGIAVGPSAELPGLAWSSFRERHETGPILTLAMSPLAVIHLPRRDVPEAALQLIAASVPAAAS